MEENEEVCRTEVTTTTELDDKATPGLPEGDESVTTNVFDDTKRLDEVAREVLEGKWGEGQARRAALADAGYDPNAVKQEISRILNPAP